MAAPRAGELSGVDCSGLYHNINRILNTYINKLLHTNISKTEHLAFENLMKDKNHIIVTADNGVALAVMDKTEYITKCEALLQDNSVYQHLPTDTFPTIHKELIKILQDYKNNNFISETDYTLPRPHGSSSPAARSYGLPKIHKNNIPMYPTVSACGIANTTLSNASLKFLKITVARLHPSFKIHISCRKIKHLSINP